MSWLREAMEKLLDLQRDPWQVIGGIPFWLDNDQRVKLHTGPVSFTSLDQMLNYIRNAGEADRAMLIVESPTRVLLGGMSLDMVPTDPSVPLPASADRRLYAVAEPVSRCDFRFSQWYPLDTFIIKLQSQFTPAGDRNAVLSVLGRATGSVSREVADDGVTQTLTVKAGVSVVERETIANPVNLAPYRSFPEIEQPESPFILRVRGGADEGFEAALFEADGGAWQLDAMNAIRGILELRLPAGIILL